MALERATQTTKTANEQRRAAVAATQRKAVVATPSPVRALQQRLGNQGIQTLLTRGLPAAQTTPDSEPKKSSIDAERPSTAISVQVPIPGVVSEKERSSLSASKASTPSANAPPPSPSGASGRPASTTKPTARPAIEGAGEVPAAPGGAKTPTVGQEGKTGGRESGASIARTALAPAVTAVHQRAAGARKHAAPGASVASAQAAALSPQVEQRRAAATQTVATLDAAKADEVKRNEFKAKLKRALEEATPEPKTQSDAERVMKTGAGQASGTLRSQLATERDAAAGSLKSAAATEVPPSTQPAPPVAALQSEPIGPPPAPISAAPVVPAPLPPERLDYSGDRGPTDQVMAANNVTKEQMQEGNDPAFVPTMAARSSAEKHEATAAARYRQGESKVQDQTQASATQALSKDLAGVHGVREQQLGKVVSQQLGTKGKDAQERQRITDTINEIKDKTRADVDAILKSMEDEAGKLFEAGLQRAEKAYEDAFEEAKGGIGTWLTTWGDDWKKHIEQSLATARKQYLREVDTAIDEVATLVDGKLKAAKQRVADGRKEVDTFVNSLDASVKQFGQEALQTVSAEFDTMGSDIDQRRDGLINKLSDQYKASYERMSAAEDKLREENKSLWQRVYDATAGLIKKIKEFKDMLLGLLGRAAAVIDDIIAHPIRFLGNLVTGVMQGLRNFMSKIGTYLLKGLMDWLFGALAGAGLQLPDRFDLQGIVSIVLQILGLTYANFRSRAVAIVGESVVGAIEKTAEVFKVILTEGVSGLWRFIKEQLANLKSMVLDAIFDFIKEKVIIAGVTWIIGLLNPASAFFKACKAIYDIVMFFVNRGSQILSLVTAVIDSIAAIAKGAVGVAAGFVENALAKSIPVAIGFMAGLLGIGDPSKPVREFIEKARAPVNKAIDWVINLAVKGVKAVGKLIAGVTRKEENKVTEKDERDDKKASTAQRTFALPKEGHTASARLINGSLQVTIASDRELAILAMLADARTEVNQDTTRDEKQRSQILSDLDGVRELVKSMEQDWKATPKQQQDFGSWAETRLSQIVSLLSHLGADGIQAFRDFKGKPLAKRYLPAEYDVRNKLYLRGSSWSGNRASVISRGKSEVIADVNAVINNRATNPSAAALAWDRLVFGGRAPDGATKETVTLQHVANTPYEVDHKDALAIHWNSQMGNNTKDAPRWQLSDSANLQYITRTQHDKKPKEPPYGRFVGSAFESVYAQGGQLNARTIDGQAFLDAPGGIPV